MHMHLSGPVDAVKKYAADVGQKLPGTVVSMFPVEVKEADLPFGGRDLVVRQVIPCEHMIPCGTVLHAAIVSI